jgi:hypothetical protein
MIIIKKILGTSMALVGGTVARYAEGTGNAAGKVVNIKLDDGIEIAFWNGDDKTKKLADRVKAARVKHGSFISALVTFKDEECKKANAINFKYNGIWTFNEKAPTPTDSGIVMDMKESADEVVITLDNGKSISFTNPTEKGYRFADRIRGKVSVGEEIEVAMQNNAVTNFKVSDNWEISRSISAIIGNTAFLDEGHTSRGNAYVRVNQSIYQGKDDKGNSSYDTAYIYFDNTQNADMINSVKEKIPPKTTNVIVCSKNQGGDKDNVYTGYYFIPITK